MFLITFWVVALVFVIFTSSQILTFVRLFNCLQLIGMIWYVTACHFSLDLLRIKRKRPEKRVELRDIYKISARLSDRLDIRSKNEVVIWGSKSFFLEIGMNFRRQFLS